MVALKRLTLAEQAYEELQEQIVSGRLPAGQRLLADELADSLAISQTPVKEALARLELDGLVEGASRRGSVVRRFTRDDVEEIYRARLLLEMHALTEGFSRGNVTPQFCDELQGIFDQQMVNIEQQTVAGLAEAIRLDREFHEMLVRLGENRLITGWHRIVLRQTQTIRNYSLARYDVGRARREHGAIVEAVRSGDVARAVDMLQIHVNASRDEFLSRPSEDLPIRP
jgi:DNA-binding GntR family transcriptional regulator